jgi:WD40 repeat protein
LAGGFDKAVLWDVAASRELPVDFGKNSIALGAAFSTDGSLILLGQVQDIYLSDASTGSRLADLTGHITSVRHIGFSPDGGLLVSSSQDGTIRMWSVAK